MNAVMPRRKSPDPKPRVTVPEKAPEKQKEEKLKIPLLEARLSALLLARNPSADIKKLPGKPSAKALWQIESSAAALDELDTFGEQYRYLAAELKRGTLTKQLHDAFVGAIVNLKAQYEKDRDHELVVRRYLRRAERLMRSTGFPHLTPSDQIDALRKKLSTGSDAVYKKIRNYLTDALIKELAALPAKPSEGKKPSPAQAEHLKPAELAAVAGILFGDDQKHFLLAFKSAFDIAQSHDIPVPENLTNQPTFANMVNYLRDALSQVLTEERKKHAFGEYSDYTPQKLNQLEEQLRSIEKMTLKLQRDDESSAETTHKSFAQERHMRASYAALPAMREIREYSTDQFSQTPEQTVESTRAFIAELHTELKSLYTQLSTMGSIVSKEATGILRQITVNRSVIKNLEEELAEPAPQERVIEVPQSEKLAERRFLNLHNQLKIKALQSEIEDFQKELAGAENKDKARLRAYITSRQDRLNGYILMEHIGNAEEDLAQLQAQLEAVNPRERRPLQDAIERLMPKIATLKKEHAVHLQQRDAREAAHEEERAAKRGKRHK